MPVQAVRFSTRELNEAQRSSRWEEWNRSALIGLACHTPYGRGLQGEEITLDLPCFTLGYVQAEAHEVSRGSETVDNSPADSMVVYAVLNGRTTLSVGSRSRAVPAGEVVIVDADRPFERTFPTSFAELALKFPRRLFEEHSSGAKTAGADVIRVSGLAARRVHALGRQLTGSVHPLGARDAETLSRVALDLVTDLTTSETVGDRLALGRLLIEQNLADPLISAPKVAAALEMSERHLSRLFAEAQTSFPKYLTERRLLRATTLLDQPCAPAVGRVSALCGFSSPAYFSRVFRNQYGFSPVQLRTRSGL